MVLSLDVDFAVLSPRLGALSTLGVPYGDAALASAVDDAQAQAAQIATEIVEQGGPADLEGKQIVALIAYLQRLGTDITKVEPLPVEVEAPAETAAASGGTTVGGSTPGGAGQ